MYSRAADDSPVRLFSIQPISISSSVSSGTAVMLSLSVRLYKRYHTLDLDTIYVLSKHQKEDR